MQNGYYVHSAPIGYEYRKVDGRGKMLFPVEPFASIIREAFEGYASNRFSTQAEVTRFFESFPDFPRNKQGRVAQQRTVGILTHPVYTGHIHSKHYGIHWRKAHHEAIVPLEVFQRVQDRRNGATYAPKRANIGDDFALRGMVDCACCGTPLRPSWTKGNTKLYPYYLCQTKGCEAYGKSIPRDKLEGDVADMLKSMQPSKGLLTLATAMFRKAWDARAKQAKLIITTGKRETLRIEKEIDAVVDRIMSASNATIIKRYEDKVESLEREKALVAEKMANQHEPPESFDERLELVL